MDLSDLEITKLCADAMGLSVFRPKNRSGWFEGSVIFALRYDPLCDDKQAMALVKKFRLTVEDSGNPGPEAWDVYSGGLGLSTNTDLNRAICECVAKMQEEGNAA